MNKFGKPWEIKEANDAFYGPKIDIYVSDAMERKFPLGTLQVIKNKTICFLATSIFSSQRNNGFLCFSWTSNFLNVSIYRIQQKMSVNAKHLL